MRRLIVPLCLIALAVQAVQASEQRCTDLGANCLCSETFNVSSYTSVPYGGSLQVFQANEVNSKRCSVEPPNYAAMTYGDFNASNNTAALAALPSGHSVNYFGAREEGHLGIWFVGNYYAGSSYMVRTAFRWYRYFTPDFDFGTGLTDGSGPCNQSGKIVEGWDGVAGFATTNHGGGLTMYNFLGWTPSVDCCYAPQVGSPTYAEMQGKWWRFEQVTTNRGGPGIDIVTYAKNVTDDGAEFVAYRVSDLSWYVPTMTPPGPRRYHTPSQYRQEDTNHPSPGCAGWSGISHYVMAGWDTNAGQRIGAAIEVEGGGGGPLGTITLDILLGIAPFLLPFCVLFVGVVCLFIVVHAKRRRPYADDTGPPPDDGAPQLRPSGVRSGPDPDYRMPSGHSAADDRDDATVGTPTR